MDHLKQTTMHLASIHKYFFFLYSHSVSCDFFSFHVSASASLLPLCLSSLYLLIIIFPGRISIPLNVVFLFFCFFFRPQSDIYFVSSAPVSSASNCSSRDTSSQSSPQTPTGYEMPVFPSPLGDGRAPEKNDNRGFDIEGF